MKAGIKGVSYLTVGSEHSAKTMRSGNLDVLATPALVAFMEETAWRSVAGELAEGESTVGILMEISHLAATPIGMEIVCETELLKVEGRKLTFACTARDALDIIGKAHHERFIVNAEAFQDKVRTKGLA